MSFDYYSDLSSVNCSKQMKLNHEKVRNKIHHLYIKMYIKLTIPGISLIYEGNLVKLS